MGQGCNSNNSCTNFFGQTTPDSKIEYTGPSIPAIGVCKGDLLSEVEGVILQKIINYATGVGISIPSIDLTTCALFTNELTCCDTCTDLPCLMQAYLTGICTLYGDVTVLQAQVSALLNGPYNTACLTLGANPTLTQIIQELITEFCALVTALNTLSATVSGFTSGIGTTIGNFLNTAITSCQGNGVLNKTGSGATINFSLRGFAPIGAIMPYGGSISGRFDSTGLGLGGTDCCGWALCNGNNSTVDLREQFIVGVGSGTMGGTGSGPSNIGTPSNYGLNTLIGSPTVILTSATIPSVGVTGTISATQPAHTHAIFFRLGVGDLHQGGGPDNYLDPTGPLGANTAVPPGGPVPGSITSYVQPSNPPITITTSGLSTTGSGSAHENRPSATALYYIQRVS